jgi:hypothetical protein
MIIFIIINSSHKRIGRLVRDASAILHGEKVKDSAIYLVLSTRRDKRSSSVIMPAVSGWDSASLPLLLGKRLLCIFWDPRRLKSQPAAVQFHQIKQNKNKESMLLNLEHL